MFSADLKSKFADEGFDGIEDLLAELEEVQAKWDGYVQKNKADSKLGKEAQAKLEHLKALKELFDVEQLSQTAAEDPATKAEAEVKALLEAVGVDDEASLLEELASAKEKLKKLEDKGQGSIPKANALRKEIEEYLQVHNQIKELLGAGVSAAAQAVSEISKAVSPIIGTVVENASAAAASKSDVTQQQTTKIRAESSVVSAVASRPPLVRAPLVKVPSIPDVPAMNRSLSQGEISRIRQSFNQTLAHVPESAEKNLMLLYAHFQMEEKKKEGAESLLRSHDEVKEIFRDLCEHVKIECLDDAEVSKMLDELGANLAIDVVDPKEMQVVSNQVWRLLRRIQPVDMELMISLVENTAKAAERISGKDILLLLGTTGSGKSTTIHFLAGSKMELTYIDGIRHIGPVESLPELHTFTTTPFTRSETRNINAVTVDYKQVGVDREGSFILCDSPGFGDTDGTEIDIANGIGIVEAVKRAEGVRPIVVLSQRAIGDRFEGISRLSRTLVSFVPQVEKYLCTFSYVFTKFSQEQKEDFPHTLKHKLKHLNADELADPAFVSLLTDMASKAESSIFLNPLKDHPAAVLAELMSVPSIKDTVDAFQNFVTPESLDKLKDQMSKHLAAIDRALDKDLPILSYKLKQLKVLHTHLSLTDTAKSYKDAVQMLSWYIKELLTDSEKQLAIALDPKNVQVSQQLEAAVQKIVELMRLEPLRLEHDSTDSSDLLEGGQHRLMRAQKTLTDRLNDDLVALFPEVLSKPATIKVASGAGDISAEAAAAAVSGTFEEVNFKDRAGQVKVSLDKMSALLGAVSNKISRLIDIDLVAFESKLQEKDELGLKAILEQYKRLLEHTTTAFAEKNIPEFVERLNQLEALQLLQPYFNTTVVNFSKEYQAHQERFIEYLEDQLSQTKRVLEKTTSLTEADVSVVVGLYDFLKNLQSINGLQDHFNKDWLQTVTDGFYSALDAAAQEVLAEVRHYDGSEHSAEAIRPFLSYLTLLKQNTELSVFVNESYYAAVDHVKLKIKDESRVAESFVDRLEGMAEISLADDQQMQKALICLNEAHILEGCYNGEFEVFTERLLKGVSAISKVTDALSLDHASIEELVRLKGLYAKALVLARYDGIIDGLGDQLAKIDASVTGLVGTLITKMLGLFQSPEGTVQPDLPNLGSLFSVFEIKAALKLWPHFKLEEFGVELELPLIVDAWNKLDQAVDAFIHGYFDQAEKTLSIETKWLATQLDSIGVAVDAAAADSAEDVVLAAEGRARHLEDLFANMNKLVDFAKAAKRLSDSPQYQALFLEQPQDVLGRWCSVDTATLPKLVAQAFRVVDDQVKARNLEALYQMRNFTAAWFVIDAYLPEGSRFNDVLLRLTSAAAECGENLIGQIKLALTSRSYEEASKLWDEIDKVESQELKKSEEELRDFLKEGLAKEHLALTEKMTALSFDDSSHFKGTEAVKMDLDAANHLTFAVDVLKDRLSDSALSDQLKGFAEKMWGETNKKLKVYLTGFDRLIEDLEFEKFEQKLKRGKEVIAVLQELKPHYLEPALLELIDAKQSLKLTKLDQLKERYSVSTYEKPTSSDADVSKDGAWGRFCSVLTEKPIVSTVVSALARAGEYDPSYSAARDEINKELRLILDKQLEHIKAASDSGFDYQIAQMIVFESLGSYLPVELFEEFRAPLQELKSSLVEAQEEFQREIEENAKTQRLAQLIDKLVDYAKKSRYKEMEKYRDRVRAKIFETRDRFQADLAKDDLVTVLKHLPKSWDDWLYYSTELGKIAPTAAKSSQYGHLYKDPECLAAAGELLKAFSDKLKTVLSEIDIKKLKNAEVLVELAKVDYVFSSSGAKLVCFLADLEGDAFLPDLKDRLSPKNIFRSLLGDFQKIPGLIEGYLKADTKPLAKLLDDLKAADKDIKTLKEFAASETCKTKFPEFVEMAKAVDYEIAQSILATSVEGAAGRILRVEFISHPKMQTANAGDRQDFFGEIHDDYQSLKSLVLGVSAHLDSGSKELEEKVCKYIPGQMDKFSSKATSLLPALFESSEESATDFNRAYDSLKTFVLVFKDENVLVDPVRRKILEIDQEFSDLIKAKRDKIWRETKDDLIVDGLVTLKAVTVSVPLYKKKVDDVIDSLLGDYKSQEDGARKIGAFGLLLNAHTQRSVAQMVIADHSAFKGYALSLRNEKTLRFTVDHVLEQLRGDGIAVPDLRSQYDEFDKEYWALVEGGLMSSDLPDYKNSVLGKARGLLKAGEEYKTKVRRLMAHVFAYWTLDNAKHFKEAVSANVSDATAESGAGAAATTTTPGLTDVTRKYLMQPHAAQVISIFRLLGLDRGATAATGLPKLDNHLVQIGTGEGKSVTLAVTATVLSILDCQVDCACYSDYLSRRDYESFEGIFKAFDVGSHIHYGTFNSLCENLVNESGDLRGFVEGAIRGEMPKAEKSATMGRPRILLIDEVDVFFNKEFYGNVYRPLTRIADPSVKQLTDYIWSVREDRTRLNLKSIKATEQFKKCCDAFSGWDELIEESVKTMLMDLRNFAKHDYVVAHDQIGYKDQDEISFSVTYGYKTLFAAYQEHEKGNISAASLNARMYLLIDGGSFSYAELPKKYTSIMGVTGTLETLSKPERALLDSEYGIRTCTYMPSVYGPNQLQFSGDSTRDVQLCADSAYFMTIRNEIESRLVGTIVKRAVLVFFESRAKLLDFYNSRELEGVKASVKILSEEVAASDKEGIIRQAVASGSITLLTREFGRGTDFICYDDRMIASGGVHVMQTFVSDEFSEEVQIRGRTARQGNKGSFSLVLQESTLERYGLKDTHIAEMRKSSKLYTAIHEARNDFFEKQYPENMRYIKDIKEDHSLCMHFLGDLHRGDMPAIRKFILERNRAAAIAAASGEAGAGETCRTVCLMDATGSMYSLLQKAKNTVHSMFERANQILTEQGVAGSFELQFVVYRNYDCRMETILQVSPWESSHENLRKFMDTISAHGGTHWEEAVEVALSHANKEAQGGDLTQVILIGDAAGNQHRQVSAGRARYGDGYWTSQGIAETHYTDESRKLAAAQVPVHAFYVDGSARPCFEEIAKITGGQSSALDIDSSAGAEMLTNLVTEKILMGVGGKKLGAALVDAYRAKFCRGYVAGSSHPAAVTVFKQAGTEAAYASDAQPG